MATFKRDVVENLAPPVDSWRNTSDDAAMRAIEARWDLHRRNAQLQATLGAATLEATGTVSEPPVVPPEPLPEFPVIASRAVLTAIEKTSEGQLIRASTLPLLEIIRMIEGEPQRMFQVNPRKWEEIIAATYEASGLFDEVTLTPRSGDRGRDVIAVKRGFGSVRLIESVKRYTPGHEVTLEDVHALLGAMSVDRATSKGIVSTTWEFAPRLKDDPGLVELIPTRLELVDGSALVERLREYTTKKSC